MLCFFFQSWYALLISSLLLAIAFVVFSLIFLRKNSTECSSNAPSLNFLFTSSNRFVSLVETCKSSSSLLMLSKGLCRVLLPFFAEANSSPRRCSFSVFFFPMAFFNRSQYSKDRKAIDFACSVNDLPFISVAFVAKVRSNS